MKLSACLIAAALSLAATAPAIAKDLPPGGLTREEVLNWLQSKGYTAKLEHDDTAKENYVSTSSDGVNWSVYLYACTDNRCTSFQYSAGWDADVAVSETTLGVWNRVKRFIRAYRGNTGVFGEYDFDLVPGGTWEMLDQSLDRWKSQVKAFSEMINQGNSWANGR